LIKIVDQFKVLGVCAVFSSLHERGDHPSEQTDCRHRSSARSQPVYIPVVYIATIEWRMPFDRQPVLKGALVELRPLRAEDFDDLYAVGSDPLIWEQHPAKDRYTEAVFRQFFREGLESGGALVARDLKTGGVIGSSRFHGYDPEISEVEIGWTFLARSHWGGAYNGEMKQLMLRHAFQFVDNVIFVIGPNNLRSQKAVEKIGGVRAGLRGENVVYRIRST
jgi:RimJ/RimL family protein N-acetyltransferase